MYAPATPAAVTALLAAKAIWFICAAAFSCCPEYDCGEYWEYGESANPVFLGANRVRIVSFHSMISKDENHVRVTSGDAVTAMPGCHARPTAISFSLSSPAKCIFFVFVTNNRCRINAKREQTGGSCWYLAHWIHKSVASACA
jgi:hypothetical protein